MDRRAGLDDQAVGQGRRGEGLDVVGQDVVAAEEAGHRLARPIEGDRAAGRSAEVDIGVGSRGAHEADDVFGHAGVDVDLADRVLHLPELLDGAHDLELVDRVAPLLLVEDDDLLDRLGIAELDAEHEAVELGLGQGEGALVLDGVLGGDDQERLGHRPGRPVDRRLLLLHALEEGALGLGRGPVDLVGQDDLGHDRARPELELLVLLVVDREAGHVRRQEVRRELDAAEGTAETLRDGLGQDGLAGAGDVLDEEVAATEERHEREPDLAMLADDDSLDIREDAVARLLDLGHSCPSARGVMGVPGRFRGAAVDGWYAGDVRKVLSVTAFRLLQGGPRHGGAPRPPLLRRRSRRRSPWPPGRPRSGSSGEAGTCRRPSRCRRR